MNDHRRAADRHRGDAPRTGAAARARQRGARHQPLGGPDLPRPATGRLETLGVTKMGSLAPDLARRGMRSSARAASPKGLHQPEHLPGLLRGAPLPPTLGSTAGRSRTPPILAALHDQGRAPARTLAGGGRGMLQGPPRRRPEPGRRTERPGCSPATGRLRDPVRRRAPRQRRTRGPHLLTTRLARRPTAARRSGT